MTTQTPGCGCNSEARKRTEPAPVSQFFGAELFEHYQEDGYLILVTSDGSSIELEPGDFIVKRMWSTAVAPYIYNRATRLGWAAGGEGE